ncbi:MAG TPA: ATP-binding protein, partial [Pirellulales bacterium]|nr:ATP-binding protein [Pirellulales bacterium]
EMHKILESLKRGQKIDHFETVRRRKDGTDVNVSLTVSPLRNTRGQIIGASKIARDITEKKRRDSEHDAILAAERAARAEAQRANRMKDEFLSNVSHEIRTPLNAILGWVQLLRAGHVTPADVEIGLEVIERNTRAQAKLVEDLLDMNRIVSGKVTLDFRPVDLASIIEAVLETIRPSADSKGICLEKSLGTGPHTIIGDPTRIQQIAWNLLSNAVKFTPPHGTVRVRLEQVDSDVRLSVTDTGQGISSDFLPFVFDRFRQADGSITRTFGGLGLGLSIVKQLVELHSGTIVASSPGQDQGATFIVNFPRRSERFELGLLARPAPCADEPEWNGPTLNGIKVLVVDDEQDTRDLVRRVLRECAAEVFTASSTREALEVLAHQRPNVILSDIGMPHQDGFELIRRIRSLGPECGGDVPAAALTAFARPEDRRRALLAGYQRHVAKPVEPAELVAVVAALAASESDRGNSQHPLLHKD